MSQKLLPFAMACASLFTASGHAAPAGSRPVNVLFIMTDQQRWDALGCAGNPVLKTPNLDRLAREGTIFDNAYSACPVCVPARTVILTGLSNYTTKVLGNGDLTNPDVPDVPTFDSVLSRAGYRTEYYGKWHVPYQFARTYSVPVKPVNKAAGVAIESNTEAFRRYLDRLSPARAARPGELIDTMSLRPYVPYAIDWHHEPVTGPAKDPLPAAAGNAKRQDKAGGDPLAGQGGIIGRLLIPPDASLAAFEGQEALAALERMDPNVPFSLTCSIGPPHPPFVVPDPYFSQYAPQDMPVPLSIDDPHANSPHPPRMNPAIADRYRDPRRVQELTAVYYAMIAQADEWVGKLLATLDRKGLRENTLVVFTSDHGEMLGDHGMDSKNIMFEGSAHIPLILRLPGTIPAGGHVARPVSHVDYFATILDYAGQPIPANEGRSLRPLIEGRTDPREAAVSAWGVVANGGPFMIRQGDWKLIVYAVGANRPPRLPVHALYNLKTDPLEMNNLIGRNPDKARALPQAQALKAELEAWMVRTANPLLANLRHTEI
ncbi:MAG: sulfatase-like hydrolase/transferase [Lacunisphaera sp.]|nr:sulfatase-like hydrolase/transferase [Lacunisphaera sp.]